jgi:hypothetical protein
MTITVRGTSGQEGKRPLSGVRRKLSISVRGNDVNLVPLTPKGTAGLAAWVDRTEFLSAVTSGVPTTLPTRETSGVSRSVMVNRSASDGPYDGSSVFIWISSPGDPDGWDFLGPRSEVRRAVERDGTA